MLYLMDNDFYDSAEEDPDCSAPLISLNICSLTVLIKDKYSPPSNKPGTSSEANKAFILSRKAGVLRAKTGINEFLDDIGKYYELIKFTTVTQDYTDAIIDALVEDKIYFDHRLYREHIFRFQRK